MSEEKKDENAALELGSEQVSYVLIEDYDRENVLNKRTLVIGAFYYVKEGSCDFSAMKKAYRELLRRNEALRMKLVGSGYGAGQIFLPAESFPEPQIRRISGGLKELLAYIRNPERPCISVYDEFLIRPEFLQGDDGSGGLLLWQNHIESDGYSEGIVMYSQLSEFYEAYLKGEEPAAAKKEYPFSDFVRREKELYEKHGQRALKWWRKQCLHHFWKYGVPFKHYPADSAIRNTDIPITGERFESFSRYCTEKKVSDNALIMAAAGGVVCAVSSLERFQMVSASHGRKTASQKKTVGPLLEFLPVFFDFSDYRSAGDAVEELSRLLIEASINSCIPYPGKENALAPAYLFGRTDSNWDTWLTFNNLRAYQNVEGRMLGVELLDLTDMVTAVNLDIYDTEGGIRINFQYLEELISPEAANMLSESFIRSLDAILKEDSISAADWKDRIRRKNRIG